MKTTFSVMMILLFLTGCTKYENGPDFSMKTKKDRLSNNWTVNEAIHLSGDAGSFQTLYPDFQFNIGEDERYTKYYRYNDVEFTYEYGAWRFHNDKLHFTTVNDSGKETDYRILRLAPNELWVRFTDEGNEWELHLFPKSTM